MAKSRPVLWFSYRGVDRQGTVHRGRIASASPALARALLRRQGIVRVMQLDEQQTRFEWLQAPIKSAEITALSRQLATLIAAGVPLLQSFDIVCGSLQKKRVIQLVERLKQDVASGSALSEAMREHPDQFSALHCALIEAGEQAGALDVMLDRIALQQEKAEHIRKKIRSALAYPMTLLGIASVVTAILLLKVVPTFAQLFTSFGADLPLPTRMVMGLSDVLTQFWLLFLATPILGLVALRWAKRHSPSSRHAWQRSVLRLPGVGPLLHQAAMARCARTLSTTFAAGIPLVSALRSTAATLGNIAYESRLRSVAMEVENGTELAVAMRQQGGFASQLTQMIAIGEHSGRLEAMLSKAADIFEADVDQRVATLTTLLEPAIMTVMGLLVGGLVVSMYLPIFRMGAVIG